MEPASDGGITDAIFTALDALWEPQLSLPSDGRETGRDGQATVSQFQRNGARR